MPEAIRLCGRIDGDNNAYQLAVEKCMLPNANFTSFGRIVSFVHGMWTATNSHVIAIIAILHGEVWEALRHDTCNTVMHVQM